MSQICTNNTRVECLQYADDTTLCSACTKSQRHAFINSVEKDIQSISRGSNYTNLIFNSEKTKVMVVLPPQMSKNRQLKEERIKVKCNNITLEKVPELKILGITLEEHFQLDKHISKLLKDWYLSLSMLKKLKGCTSIPLREQLEELLIFSRLDYCNSYCISTQFIDVPQYQVKRLLKLQKACTGFVLN